MRDLFFIAFLGLFLLAGLRRPFLLVLVYSYIDIVSPQRLSYYLLNSIPISALAFAAAVGGWLLIDDKSGTRFSFRQGFMLALLALCAWTTAHADFPIDAKAKWDWVWKALIFAVFLPLTLRTRLRIEALILIMVLCASSIVVTGGIKTLTSGGGYGVLNLMVAENSGLYEGSTISTVAIAIIPLILWLTRYGTIFPPDWRVKYYGYALCGACLLIPVGTETRTGLLCIVLLGFMMWLRAKRRIALGVAMAVAALIAIPFLPASFTARMSTIETHQSDESASTRVAVWKWTWDYAKQHPGGGGFNAFLGNSFSYAQARPKAGGGTEQVIVVDQGRAYHNAYFEMLGEQGWLGLFLWAMLHICSLLRTEWIRRRYRRLDEPGTVWVAPLALALQQGHFIYLLGAMFIGIAIQPFIFMLIAAQIGLDTYLARQRRDMPVVPPIRRRVAAA